MRRDGALAERVEPVFYDYPVKYQHDRTGWMVWTEGLSVFSIASSKLEAHPKLKSALRAYFRSVIRHGDPLPATPRRVSTGRAPIMVCVAKLSCYCGTTDERVLADLKRGSVPDEALVRNCCWKWICKVRGTSRFGLPDGSSDWEEEARAWSELCAKRGYLLERQNPRGF